MRLWLFPWFLNHQRSSWFLCSALVIALVPFNTVILRMDCQRNFGFLSVTGRHEHCGP